MTPDLQAALICEDVRMEISGSNSLIGVLSAIAAPALPVRALKLCVFTRWTSGRGEYVQRTRILSHDDEKEVASTETKFTLATEENHATNVAVFGGLEFNHFGHYPVEILLDNDLVLRFSLPVVKVDPQQQMPSS